MTDARSATDITAERLREVVLDLDAAKEHEHLLRQEATALLEGLKALTEARTPDAMFRRLLEALREPLGFDAALVTRPASGDAALVVEVTTDPVFADARFPLGKTFKRALGGKVIIHLDTRTVPEWQAQPEAILAAAGSALLLPLQGETERALIVFVRREPRGFQVRHEQLARRLQPLATQALREVERTALIARSNRDMRAVLDNVAQGLLMVGRDRAVVGERSAVVERWFGPIATGARLEDVLGAHSPDAAAWLLLAWECLLDDELPRELTLDQLPRRIELADRVLRVDYRPVPSLDRWTHLLIVLSDITLELERERAEARQREFVVMVSRFMRDRRGFEAFVRETDLLLAHLTTTGQSATEQARALHTLKGNASLFELHSFASVVHALEDDLGAGPLAGAALEPVVRAWQAIGRDLEPLRGGARTIDVEPREFDALVEGLRRHVAPQTLLDRVLAWRAEPVARSLERLAEQARVLAARLGRGPIVVEVDADDERLEAEAWRPFFSNLVHAIRNSVDHGLEPEAERARSGKPVNGRIVLRARRTVAGLTIAVIDDGRGIAWDKIASIATARGLPAATHDDLVECLFRDGFSTKDTVTDVSGRGVGLAALRAAVRDRGGRVEITTAPGEGTTLAFVFPDPPTAGTRRDPRLPVANGEVPNPC